MRPPTRNWRAPDITERDLKAALASLSPDFTRRAPDVTERDLQVLIDNFPSTCLNVFCTTCGGRMGLDRFDRWIEQNTRGDPEGRVADLVAALDRLKVTRSNRSIALMLYWHLEREMFRTFERDVIGKEVRRHPGFRAALRRLAARIGLD